MIDLKLMRREYLKDGLHRKDLRDDPMEQFEVWLDQVVKADITDPTAMTLATVDAAGQPTQRIVLLKHMDARGFVFYTNYESRKAQDIASNPKVSLHFPWHVLERQVIICGTAGRVSPAESLNYFSSRPEESQLAAWASAQSRPISSRQMLMKQLSAMKEKFRQGKIPLPDFWGGYRVKPTRFEFWQGGAHRLHDRFQYTRTGDGWTIERLAP